MRSLIYFQFLKRVKFFRNLTNLITSYCLFVHPFFQSFRLLLDLNLLAFFRKFLQADYCWFLFTSSRTAFLKRVLEKKNRSRRSIDTFQKASGLTVPDPEGKSRKAYRRPEETSKTKKSKK